MKPTIGRIIIVVAPQAASNGADRAPAIITRVFGEVGDDTRNGPVRVNATCFPDQNERTQSVGSVELFDTEADAAETREAGMPYAYWPERVA